MIKTDKLTMKDIVLKNKKLVKKSNLLNHYQKLAKSGKRMMRTSGKPLFRMQAEYKEND